MYKYKRNGFTLVELMAVIIIISLIALLTFPNIINQIKKTKKSNNKMIEDVVIEQAKKYVSDNEDELTEDEYCMPISTLIDNDYIKEELVKVNDIKDNKVIHLIRSDNDTYEVVDKNKCVIIPTAVKYLLKKTNSVTVTNYTDGNTHEMYTFEHASTEQTPALTDYRYIGSDPYNYVNFNNELWRIIGVFDVEGENGKYEKRVKLIRNESLGNRAWTSKYVGTNSWENMGMKTYLNEDYILSISFSSLIDSVKYYLAGPAGSMGEDTYINERGTTVFSGRSIFWIGKIALMYPSDYIFTYSLGIDDVCYETPTKCNSDNNGNPSKGWIYYVSRYNHWTLVPNSGHKYSAYVIGTNGGISTSNGNNSGTTRPVLYLKPKVKIISGDGTMNNAYKLSM